MTIPQIAADWKADYVRHYNPDRPQFAEALFGRSIVMGEREGPRFLNSEDGRWLYNVHCNGGTYNLGHRHPAIVEALREAVGHLDGGNHWFTSPWRAMLAKRLSATTNDLMPGAMLTSSGQEAADLAIKFARWHTGRLGIISAEGGYHGLCGLASAAGSAHWRTRFGCDLPGFSQVPFNDLAAMEQAVTDQTAAVILESIPATLGMAVPVDGYLKAVQEICHRKGALLILDEVQTGMGRTGTMWYYQQTGTEPDMVMVGKGLGGGIYPVSALLLGDAMMKTYATDSTVYGSTYGGSEIGCVVGCAVLDVTEGGDFLGNVQAVADRLSNELIFDGEVRQCGLFMGLKGPERSSGRDYSLRLYEQGIFAKDSSNDPSVLQYLPPLILTDSEVDDIVARTNAALAGPAA